MQSPSPGQRMLRQEKKGRSSAGHLLQLPWATCSMEPAVSGEATEQAAATMAHALPGHPSTSSCQPMAAKYNNKAPSIKHIQLPSTANTYNHNSTRRFGSARSETASMDPEQYKQQHPPKVNCKNVSTSSQLDCTTTKPDKETGALPWYNLQSGN